MHTFEEALKAYMPYSYKDFTIYSWKDISDEDKHLPSSFFASIMEKCNEQKTVKQCDLNVVRRYFVGDIAGHACALPYRHACALPYRHACALPYRHACALPYRHACALPYRHACALPYRHRLGRDQTLTEYIDSLISYLLEEMIDTGLMRTGFKSIREDNELYRSVKEFIR